MIENKKIKDVKLKISGLRKNNKKIFRTNQLLCVQQQNTHNGEVTLYLILIATMFILTTISRKLVGLKHLFFFFFSTDTFSAPIIVALLNKQIFHWSKTVILSFKVFFSLVFVLTFQLPHYSLALSSIFLWNLKYWIHIIW